MNKNALANLVYILKGRGLISDTIHSSVEEQVARFLYVVGHNLRNRKVKFQFRQSGETVSRQFNHVLKAIISLEDLFLKQPDGKECPAEIKNNSKCYPYFKYEDDQEDSTVNDKKNLKWSDEMDRFLVDCLMEQKLKGQKIGDVFTSTAYKAAATSVSSKFHFFCDSGLVKNRVKTLKKHLASVKDILQNGSGFGFNYSTKMIEAEAGVWDAYLEAKPAASNFRYTPIPNYENLNEFFGKDRATGS
ncbi:hypothetical protein BUALT_Bualt02G0106700 [Buddleja alternifolia]|uniref:Myb/SANT-like domain-containing protein n=1 Tax=Buddleja alternifolia TaxID=168488 RepID=A0AAV6Y9Z8_9LAMI|nr:hypothetical protein BUALT_Bualt02G0106700 [Buddleja alternifolia]